MPHRIFENDKITLLDLNDYEMPIFSVDREKNGYPEQAKQFIKQIENCDCIIVSLAEHNKAYTVAFKNILDWCSRIDINIFKNKPMLLLSTSPGGFGGGNVMALAQTFFPKCGGNIIESFSLPSFSKNFVETVGIIDTQIKIEFELKIKNFKSKITFN